MILSRLVDTFSTRILYLCSFHRTFTWYINIFRLFKDQRLIHTNPPLGVITFVFRMDLHHNICQRLILPRTVFINKILIKSLSADMQHPAIKSDFFFQSAVFFFEKEINFILSFLLTSDGSRRKKALAFSKKSFSFFKRRISLSCSLTC